MAERGPARTSGKEGQHNQHPDEVVNSPVNPICGQEQLESVCCQSEAGSCCAYPSLIRA